MSTYSKRKKAIQKHLKKLTRTVKDIEQVTPGRSYVAPALLKAIRYYEKDVNRRLGAETSMRKRVATQARSDFQRDRRRMHHTKTRR